MDGASRRGVSIGRDLHVSYDPSPTFTPSNYIDVLQEHISHGGSQGFKSPHLHSQSCRSERRQRQDGDARCMSGPRWGRTPDPRSNPKGVLGSTTLITRPHDDHGA
jgi:hypothetical protein